MKTKFKKPSEEKKPLNIYEELTVPYWFHIEQKMEKHFAMQKKDKK